MMEGMGCVWADINMKHAMYDTARRKSCRRWNGTSKMQAAAPPMARQGYVCRDGRGGVVVVEVSNVWKKRGAGRVVV